MGISENVLMMELASICIYTRVGTRYVELGFGLGFSDVFDDLLVEVFHRGVLVCGRGFSSHFHEMDFIWVFA